VSFSKFLKSLVAVTCLSILAGGIYLTQKQLWTPTKKHFYELGNNPGYVPRAQEIKPFLFGFENLTADMYWLRAIQYVGSNALNSTFSALPAYFDLITDLDPHFVFAYKFAGLTLPLNQKTKNDAVKLLEKGIKNNPQAAELYTDLAFQKYYYEEDYATAIALYQKCLKLPDCLASAATVSASLESRRGRYQVALKMWLSKLKKSTEKNDFQQDLVIKKIGENIKLIALNCAAKNLLKQGENITDVTDLKGFKLRACNGLPPALIKEFGKQYGLPVINDVTLENTFSHNAFVWDDEQQKVKTLLW